MRDKRAGASVSAGGGEKWPDLVSIRGLALPGLADGLGMGWERKRELRGWIRGSGAEQPRRCGALNGAGGDGERRSA